MQFKKSPAQFRFMRLGTAVEIPCSAECDLRPFIRRPVLDGNSVRFEEERIPQHAVVYFPVAPPWINIDAICAQEGGSIALTYDDWILILEDVSCSDHATSDKGHVIKFIGRGSYLPRWDTDDGQEVTADGHNTHSSDPSPAD